MATSTGNTGLTAFELRRAANAKANNEILRSISTTSARVFGPAAAAATAAAKSKKKAPAAEARKSTSAGRPRRLRAEPAAASARATPVVTRRSLRVAGLEADPTVPGKRGRDGGGDDDRAGGLLAHGLGESARDKRQRVSGDLTLGDMQVDGGRWQGSLAGLGLLGTARAGGAQPGVRTFRDDGDGDGGGDKAVAALRQELGRLQLYDKFAVKDLKLTKERIYAMAFHPAEDKAVVFAGDKEGRLGIFDASQEPAPKEDDDDDDGDDGDASDADAPAPVIVGFQPHARTISAVCVRASDAQSVFTASYDTTVRRLDLGAHKSVEVYAPEGDAEADEGDRALSCLDFPEDDTRVVYFSTLGGTLGRHDLRAPPQTADRWTALHEGHKIGGFALSPRQPHLVATASLDRTVKVWDLRGVGGGGGEGARKAGDGGAKVDRPQLVGEDAARLSVSHAAWGGGGQIATTSYDDTIRIYEAGGAGEGGGWAPGDVLTPAHAVAHNNQTGRWVTILKPQWQRRPPGGGPHRFAVGNMNRFVDVFAADGTQLAQLDGDGITAVPAVAHFHPTQNWVAGGNASGKLTLWM